MSETRASAKSALDPTAEASMLTSLPVDTPVHELVERRAATSPNAGALVCDDRLLTYRELDALANQLARHLQQTIGRISGLPGPGQHKKGSETQRS